MSARACAGGGERRSGGAGGGRRERRAAGGGPRRGARRARGGARTRGVDRPEHRAVRERLEQDDSDARGGAVPDLVAVVEGDGRVLDEASRTAIGAPLESFPISQYGDGLISNDTAGTESELVSDLVYVCTVENTTVAFDHGYEVGYRPAAGVGVILIQALPDGSMLWTIDTTSAHAAARLPHVASRPAARCSPRAATAASPARR